MKRFRFKLQALLDMKKRTQQDIALCLSKKNGELFLAQNRLKQCRERFAQFQEIEKQKRCSGLDPLHLKMSVSYRFQLLSEIDDALRSIIQLQTEVKTITQSLIVAKKETRALELLMEKKRELWKKDYQRAEREFIDEITQKKVSPDPAVGEDAFLTMV